MQTLRDLMLRAGLVKIEQTPEHQRVLRQKAEQERIQKRIDNQACDVCVDPQSSRIARLRGAAILANSGRAIPENSRVRDDSGPPRVRGEMIWAHKTAPILMIEGRKGPTPEEIAAGRRRG